MLASSDIHERQLDRSQLSSIQIRLPNAQIAKQNEMKSPRKSKLYKGCEIEVHRSYCLGGYSEVYWSAWTDTNYEIASGFGGGTVKEMRQAMKRTITEFVDVFHRNEDEWEKARHGTIHLAS